MTSADAGRGRPGRSLRRTTARSPGRGAVGLVAAALLVGVLAVGLPRLRVDTGVEAFLPRGDPSVAATAEVAAAFGGDPVVVLLETAAPRALTGPDQLPRLLALEGELAGLPDVAAVYGPATVLNQIAGRTQELVTELVGHRDGLHADAVARAVAGGATPEQAQAAAAAATVGFDARYGALLVAGLPVGLPTLHNADFVRAVAYDAAGEPRPRWRFVLPRADAVAVLVRPRQDLDQAGTERLVQRVRDAVATSGVAAERVTVSGVPVLTSGLAATVRAEIPLLGGAALVAVGAVFAVSRWTGRRHRLLPLAATALATATTLAVFGLIGRPLTLPAVAVLPILLGVGSDFAAYLQRRAPRRTVVVAALATAAAFAALAAAPVPALRDLGAALALGTVLALGAALLLQRWSAAQPRRRADGAATPAATGPAGPTGPGHLPPGPGRPRVPGGRARRAVVAAAAALVGVAGLAVLPAVAVRADLDGLAAGLPALDDARHVERVIGSSGELAVAVTGPDVLTPQALAWMRSAQDAVVLAQGSQARPVLSPPALLGFLGAEPSPDEIAAALRLLPRYLTGSVVAADGRLAVLLFAVRLDDADGLRALRDGVLAALPAPPAGLEVRLTGLPVAALAAHESISAGRYPAALLGVLAAGVVLAAGLRRRGDAARAVASAALATAAGVLAMWLTETAFTPVTVALGALTAAVACEFSVLLAEAARRADPGLRRAVAVAAAASATGYAVLALSQLAVVAQFGVVLAGAVGLAYAAAALLAWLVPPRGPAVPAVPPTPSRQTAGAAP